MFKGLLGNDAGVERPAELRALLTQIQRERAAFEAQTERARQAAGELRELARPVADLQVSLSEMQTRVKALERLAPVLSILDEQTETVAKVQRRTETQLARVSGDAQRLRDEIVGLRGALDAALALRQALGGLLEAGGGFRALRSDADQIVSQLRDFAAGLDGARERQDEVGRAVETAAARVAALEERHALAANGVTAVAGRAAELDAALQQLARGAAEAEEIRRQLATITALADRVTQTVAVLEGQRDAVDRAHAQAAQASDLLRDLDQRMRLQEESAKGLAELEARIEALQGQHRTVLEQSDQIARRHAEVEQEERALRARLEGLRDEIERAGERFAAEHEGLDAATRRVADLRGALGEAEARFRALEDASRGIAGVQSRAEGLDGRLAGVVESVAQLEAQAERVGAVRAAAQRLEEVVDDMSRRVGRLEETKPFLDAMQRDVAALKGANEVVQDALERIRAAATEVARAREGQVETSAWLATVETSVSALRAELGEVDRLKPSVEQAREGAQRVVQHLTQIEARRELAEELDRRLAALATLGTELEERGRGLTAQMSAADERFAALARRAAEAEHIERLVPDVISTVGQAERRAGELRLAVASLEKRCRVLDEVSERTRTLGQEIDRREQALRRAVERLARVEAAPEARHSAFPATREEVVDAHANQCPEGGSP